MLDKLLIQYAKAFNPDKSQKICGREVCMELISLCEEYTGCKGDFGNKENGMMNIENIQNLITEIHQEIEKTLE